MGAGSSAQELTARLTRLLEERRSLVEGLERAVMRGETASPELHERLKALTSDQEAVMAALRRLVPPDGSPVGDDVIASRKAGLS